ncbi:HetP family heterocyst commitment protein [Cylindrospermopsis curvispora]|uniref:HetP family heterocyst commitment protein n=1 Tax=Cylindrospermopsis curvispora GIHE-G1 TaxID=2666332 RepID=A0A7H0F0E4_9CYAN|nr:HetP family heterocyst commitment protein [Cylindrospermopsis curvispora]QNP29510.1 HetP family heterocyst commitment protein [Cylindrospermopsis curvispora GIHE-G1]
MIPDKFEQKQELENVDITFQHIQIQQIIHAIIAGKYAWACILFISFSGRDPLRYIPEEVYNKLVRDDFPLVPTSRELTTDKK